MRAQYGLTVPLLLLTASFAMSVPHAIAQETETYTISGRVTSDAGAPLSGVLVNAYSYSEDGARRMMMPEEDRSANAVTDADGRYSFELAAGKGWINVYYEKWRQSDGRELSIDSDQTIDFTLRTPPPKDAIIEGRVVDANGDPISGAEVSLQYGCCYAMPAKEAKPEPSDPVADSNASTAASPAIAIMPPYHDDYQTMVTGDDGRFRFEAYPGPRQISAWAKGFAQTTVEVEAVANETKTVEVELEKVPAADAVVEGRVIDSATGAPLANAQVNLRGLEWGRYAYAETGADGSFRFTTIPGWAEISVSYYPRYDEPIPLAADGSVAKPTMVVRGNEYYPSTQLVRLASGDNEVNVALDPKPKPTIALTGYVVDPDTEKAVPDAHVAVWNHETGDWGEAITDATGSYRILVRAGHYSANAWKEGYLGGSQTFVVTGEPAQRFDLLLPKGTTKWAPCYEGDDACGGPIMYARGGEVGYAYAEGGGASGGGATTEPKAVGSTTGAPPPAPAVAPQSTSAATEDASSAGATAGGDRSRAASFEGSGGGLPEYDPDASPTTIPGNERGDAPLSEVPGLGLVGALLALGVAVLVISRRRG